MARTLNSPDDVDNYQDNRLICRKVTKPMIVTEAKWGVTDDHPAEEASFLWTGEGWDKATALRLG